MVFTWAILQLEEEEGAQDEGKEEVSDVSVDLEESEEESEYDPSSDDSEEELGNFLEDVVVEEGEEPTAERIKEASDKSDVRVLATAFRKIAKAAEMQSRAFLKISQVLSRNPSLEKIARMLGPLPTPLSGGLSSGPTSMTQSVAASLMGRVSQVPKTPAPQGPVKDEEAGCNVCPYCGFSAHGWNSVDGHIRKEHTHIAYGPCGVSGCTFTTWYKFSFNRHFEGCIKKSKGQKEEPIKRAKAREGQPPEKKRRVSAIKMPEVQEENPAPRATASDIPDNKEKQD